MFTGLIQGLGEVLDVSGDDNGRYVNIAYKFKYISHGNFSKGDSIACNGICLTIIKSNTKEILVYLGIETLSITTASSWKKGSILNLEPSLRLGDSVDGHFVYGHIDGVAKIQNISVVGDSKLYEISVSSELISLIAPKSSVALDGVSLTIVEINNLTFKVMIIPYTLTNTSFSTYSVNIEVNIEVDMLARYVKRHLDLNTIE